MQMSQSYYYMCLYKRLFLPNKKKSQVEKHIIKFPYHRMSIVALRPRAGAERRAAWPMRRMRVKWGRIPASRGTLAHFSPAALTSTANREWPPASLSHISQTCVHMRQTGSKQSKTTCNILCSRNISNLHLAPCSLINHVYKTQVHSHPSKSTLFIKSGKSWNQIE